MNVLRRWAFEPVDTAPMAVLRMACGLISLGWAISYLPNVGAFLSSTGVQPHASTGTAGWWTVPLGSPWAALAALMVAAALLTVGWHSRVMSVVVAFLLLAIQRRDVFVLNSGDLLLREMAIYVALMPSGECWSLDARRRAKHDRQPQLRAPWGLRLLQLQISAVYLFSVVGKLGGTTWQNGSAVGEVLQIGDLQRLVVPQSIATSVTVSAILTYGTLVIEASLVLGLWFERTRFKVMIAGLLLHLGIEATILIGWFSFTILSCYLAFIPGEQLRQVAAFGMTKVGSLSDRGEPTVELSAQAGGHVGL